MGYHGDLSDRSPHWAPAVGAGSPLDTLNESSAGAALMSTKGMEDAQKSILRTLQALEEISRRLCEGNPVDLSHAGAIIDVLKNAVEKGQPASDWESPGAKGATSEAPVRLGLESLGKRCFKQMRESLTRIRLYSDDIHHKVNFVNAAIELMNHLRRRLLADNQFVI